MIKSIIYNLLRIMTPYWLRQWLKRRNWFIPITRSIFGYTVYCKSYCNDLERFETTSVPYIAKWINDNLKPKRLIDIGCGPGHLMLSLVKEGVDCIGVDISDSALTASRKKGLYVEHFNLTDKEAVLPNGSFDVAISCEVAEHIEAQYAHLFVQRLISAAPTVYITAAEPDPNIGVGLYHFNEQPNSYWIRLFDECGYIYDETASEKASKYLKDNKVISYLAKPLIFRRRN